MTPATVDLTRSPLFQQDLFHCILDCLVAPEASPKQLRESRRVLVSLARTCRAFLEPSLDRLWSKLDSLEPLVRCFATVLNEEMAKTPPSPTEWVIIHRYSHRIRDLTIGPLDRLSLFFLRSTSLHPCLLVPNLRALRWRLSISAKTRPFLSTIFTQRLLSPSLVSLNVTLSNADDATLQSYLANYLSLCSNLKSIVINVTGRGQASRTTVGTLSRAIPRHEHLECLSVSVPVDDVALTHIAVSPTLKRVALVLHPDQSNLHDVCIPSDITPFRNVEELSLEVWDLYFVTTLLRTQDQTFRAFVLRHRSPPTIDALSTFFTALASRPRTRSLRSVRFMPVISGCAAVEEHHLTPSESDALALHHHLSSDTLRLLTPLTHLRELVIDAGRWFSIDDDDLVSLARNWPSLQVLRLNCRQFVRGYPWRPAKYVTFKGLSSLLACCPDLRNFCLPLDAKDLDTLHTEEIFCKTDLRYIQFPHSPTVILVWWKRP